MTGSKLAKSTRQATLFLGGSDPADPPPCGYDPSGAPLFLRRGWPQPLPRAGTTRTGPPPNAASRCAGAPTPPCFLRAVFAVNCVRSCGVRRELLCCELFQLRLLEE